MNEWGEKVVYAYLVCNSTKTHTRWALLFLSVTNAYTTHSTLHTQHIPPHTTQPILHSKHHPPHNTRTPPRPLSLPHPPYLLDGPRPFPDLVEAGQYHRDHHTKPTQSRADPQREGEPGRRGNARLGDEVHCAPHAGKTKRDGKGGGLAKVLI